MKIENRSPWQGGHCMLARFVSRRLRGTALAGAAFVAAALVLSTTRDACANELPWHNSLEAAVASAHREGKPILTFFTGSDWCQHCKTLEANVLETNRFRAWAEDHVVLLEIDMPQQGITKAERAERSQICKAYGIRSFPSVVLIDQDGTKLYSQAGYGGQSAPLWIEMVAKHLPPKATTVAEASSASETPALR
jgi:thioredoxin-related protein